MNILLDAHNKALAKVLEKAEKVKAKKVNAAGVEVMGTLDKYGQATVETYRDAKEWDMMKIEEELSICTDDMSEAEESVRAAELNNVHARMKLAEFCRSGRYVKKSKRLRFNWLLRAANNGYMEAQGLVAECFEKGRGAEHNDGKAYKYYKLAAEQGSEYGKIKAKEFELFKFYK